MRGARWLFSQRRAATQTSKELPGRQILHIFRCFNAVFLSRPIRCWHHLNSKNGQFEGNVFEALFRFEIAHNYCLLTIATLESVPPMFVCQQFLFNH